MITVYWQTVSSVNVLESTPPSVNGVLTACAGQQISLTCSHNTGDAGNTFWVASPLVDCTSFVAHTTTVFAFPCGPFMFERIALVEFGQPSPPVLNSTAVATATVILTSTTVECSRGTFSAPVRVGNISLRIVGEF